MVCPCLPPTDSKLRSNPRTRDAGKNATGILGSWGGRSNRHLGPTTFHWDLHDPEADFVSNRLVFVWIPAPKNGLFVGYSCWNRASTSYTLSVDLGVLVGLLEGFLFTSPSTEKKAWACFCKKKVSWLINATIKIVDIYLLINIEIYWNIHQFSRNRSLSWCISYLRRKKWVISIAPKSSEDTFHAPANDHGGAGTCHQRPEKFWA